MLKSAEIDRLRRRLDALVTRLTDETVDVGQPGLVEAAAHESAELFRDFTKALPNKHDAHSAAAAFLRGQRLSERQTDLIASVLCDPIREQRGAKVVGHGAFNSLIGTYRRQAQQGGLWRLTWYGLVCSYFAFDPMSAGIADKTGWTGLQRFLVESWPLISDESGSGPTPDWVQALRRDPSLLTPDASDRYAIDYLNGDESGLQRVARQLAVPDGSWFWHSLVLGAVRYSTTLLDQAFKSRIPRLIELIESRPAYRDDALELVLERYHRCKDSSLHPQLRDYAIRKDVWRNPKLRDAGIATAWNRVSEGVWRMVLQWVNEANLRDFFEILAARRNSDEGRLAFWSKYLDQIRWTRLIFSEKTKVLATSNASIRSLIAREEGAYATMSTNADVDGFMMQIGGYLIVEFSQTPNAAYIYKVDDLPFEPYARTYAGTTLDLKAGFRGERAARISHVPNWEQHAEAELRLLGIRPDSSSPPAAQAVAVGRSAAPEPVNASGSRPPEGASFTMHQLCQLVAAYPSAEIRDERTKRGIYGGGRLWIEDPNQDAHLARKLKEWGFRWANSRAAHYYPYS